MQVSNFTPCQSSNANNIEHIYTRVLKYGWTIKLVSRTSFPTINKLEYCFLLCQPYCAFIAPNIEFAYLRTEL